MHAWVLNLWGHTKEYLISYVANKLIKSPTRSHVKEMNQIFYAGVMIFFLGNYYIIDKQYHLYNPMFRLYCLFLIRNILFIGAQVCSGWWCNYAQWPFKPNNNGLMPNTTEEFQYDRIWIKGGIYDDSTVRSCERWIYAKVSSDEATVNELIAKHLKDAPK